MPRSSSSPLRSRARRNRASLAPFAFGACRMFVFPYCFSVLLSSLAFAGSGATDLVISEVHYHPLPDSAADEFVEIHNRGSKRVELSGWELRGGVRYTFPEGASIGPLEWIAIAGDGANLKSRAPAATVLGEFEGRLANDGEILTLAEPGGRVVDRVHWHDGEESEGSLWPREPDGLGPSLERIDFGIAADGEPLAWAPSRSVGGTPGAPNRAAGAIEARRAPVRLNEVRVAGSESFVELVPGSDGSASLDGLVLIALSPEGARRELELEGRITAGKYREIAGNALDALVSPPPRAILLESRDGAWLDTLEIDPASLEKLAQDESLGRSPDRTGPISILPRATRGSANASPDPPPIVISELFYHGRDGAAADEFVEIQNTGKETLSLSGWRFSEAIRYEFAAGEEIGPGELVVIAKDPEALRGRIVDAAALHIVGPFKGRLGNSGETLSLRDSRGQTVDRVAYRDRAPWPRAPDGEGFSLELLDPELDNSFGAAWTSGPPGGSPGRANVRARVESPPVVVEVRHEPALPGRGEPVDLRVTVLSGRRITSVAAIVEPAVSGARSRPSRVRLRALKEAPRTASVYGATLRLPAGPELWSFQIEVRDSRGGETIAPERTLTSSSSARESSDTAASPDPRFLIGIEPEPFASSGSASLAAPSIRRYPRFRVFLLPEHVAEWKKENSRTSERWFPCTFVASFGGTGLRAFERVYHGATIRFRGNNSRNPPDGAMSYRMRLRDGDDLDGRDRLILNAFAPTRQIAAARVLRDAGLVVSTARPVRLRLSGREERSYAHVEPVDEALLREELGEDGGALFRGKRNRAGEVAADLEFHGADAELYRAAYVQENRRRDGSGALVSFLEALSATDPAELEKRAGAAIDFEEWGAYFAANHVLGNTEGGLSTGDPDDYYLYERADGRFILIPWDHDSTFDDAGAPLFRNSLPVVRRVLDLPPVARAYHATARHLLDGVLRPAKFARAIEDLRPAFPGEAIDPLARFVVNRQHELETVRKPARWPQAVVLSPGDGDVANPGESSGSLLVVPQGESILHIGGSADPAFVARVRVGGGLARWDPVAGFWDATVGRIPDRHEPLWIDRLGPSGALIGSVPLAVMRAHRTAPLVSAVRRDEALSSEGGIVWRIGGEIVVESGATLDFAPGTVIVAEPGSRLVVHGRLRARGELRSPVWIAPADGRRGWGGVIIDGTRARAELSHLRFEGGGIRQDGEGTDRSDTSGACLAALGGGAVALDHVVCRGAEGIAFRVEGGVHAISDVAIVDGGSGIVLDGASAAIERLRLERLAGDGLAVSGRGEKPVEIDEIIVRHVFGAGILLRGAEVEISGAELTDCGRGIDAESGAHLVLRGGELREHDVAIVARASDDRSAASGPRTRLEIEATTIAPHVEVWRLGAGVDAVFRGGELPESAAVPKNVTVEATSPGRDSRTGSR